MVLTSKEVIGKLQPEVGILPAHDSPRCLGSESMARGVAKPGNGGSRAQSGRDQGSDRPPARNLHRVGFVAAPTTSARALMEMSGQRLAGAWLT